MENLMNYSMGEIPPAEVLRLLLKHGVRRIPVAAIHELFDVVKPHLSFFERSAVDILIRTFYNEDLTALLKSVEKRPSLRALPKSLMYDSRFTIILRKYMTPEQFVAFQLDVIGYGENNTQPVAASASPAATLNSHMIATATANNISLPANVLGPSRGPRRTTRSRRLVASAAANSESNENSNTNTPVIGITGPRRNYPNLVPVALPGTVRAPSTLTSLAPRHKGQVGYKNTTQPPTLEMPRPAATGVRSWVTGKYRRVAATRRGRRSI